MQKENNPFFYEFMRPLVNLIVKGFYHPKFINKEVIPSEGAAVIAGNHRFYFDPLLVDVCTKRCVYSLCWYTYYDKAKWFFKSLGTIRVQPHVTDSIGDAVNHLNKGLLINLFPEGYMNKTDEILLPFKRGAVTMAKEANCKIIPFAITGKYKFRSKDLTIRFGEPLDVSNLSFEEANELLANTIKKMILEA